MGGEGEFWGRGEISEGEGEDFWGGRGRFLGGGGIFRGREGEDFRGEVELWW